MMCHIKWVRWSSTTTYPEVAIRYEKDAYRPDKIDAKTGVATTQGNITEIRNPADYYRHLALAAFLEEADGEEFMMLNGTLFRIDAAATCHGAKYQMIESMLGIEFNHSTDMTPSFVFVAERLQGDTPLGYPDFYNMLQKLADDPTLPADAALLIQASVLKKIPEVAPIFRTYIQERQELVKRHLDKLAP